jgi:MFS family permease
VIGGRLITGYLLDRVFAPRLAASLMLAAAACFAVFLVGGANFALGLAIAVGLSFGAEVDLVGYMVSRYFGARNYGRLFGISYSLCIVGMMLSPLLFGQIRDSLGSYRPMILFSVFLLLAAAALFWRLPPYPTRAAEPDSEEGNEEPAHG